MSTRSLTWDLQQRVVEILYTQSADEGEAGGEGQGTYDAMPR